MSGLKKKSYSCFPGKLKSVVRIKAAAAAAVAETDQKQ